jgi:hypothetical protein
VSISGIAKATFLNYFAKPSRWRCGEIQTCTFRHNRVPWFLMLRNIFDSSFLVLLFDSSFYSFDCYWQLRWWLVLFIPPASAATSVPAVASQCLRAASTVAPSSDVRCRWWPVAR